MIGGKNYDTIFTTLSGEKKRLLKMTVVPGLHNASYVTAVNLICFHTDVWNHGGENGHIACIM